MKVLVLGAGEMGESAIRDLHQYGSFDEIVIATRSPQKAEAILDTLGSGPRVRVATVDVADIDAVARLMEGCTVTVNCAGPNYKYEIPVARAAIAAGVHLVDINDEFEITFRMLELDEEARAAGITVVLGLGASPGVNNMLVRAAADQLDTVEEIRTAWVMSASDPGGLALSYHLLYSLSGRAVTIEDGRMIEVASFIDGAEEIEFPQPVGRVTVYHVGHPEPITLARTFPEARYVDDKASFNEPEINALIRTLGTLARNAPGPLRVNGMTCEAMDFAASYLRGACLRHSTPREGALRVRVTGLKDGARRDVHFSSAGRLTYGTGIPAAIGAVMIAEGDITQRGVLPPEACIDAKDFFFEMLTRRNVAQLNGWIEDAGTGASLGSISPM